MIKHAGRKYSIPTKPKKSYTAAAQQEAASRMKAEAPPSGGALPLSWKNEHSHGGTADYTQVSSPAQLLLAAVALIIVLCRRRPLLLCGAKISKNFLEA